jgi:ATP phosphoribosyltransferase regulatory subunit
VRFTPEASAALARIARVSGVRAEPPALMPAEVILELSGEAVRSRLCTFNDASGAEHCLRPDLTTPIAQMVAAGELPVARYHGAGPVYRLPPRGSDDPVEHLQLGFEWFGNAGSVAEDAEAVAVALEAAQAGGVSNARVRFGDVAIYHALLASLPLSPHWRDRLRRAFSRRKGPRELVLAAHQRTDTAETAARIGRLPQDQAERAVRNEIEALGVEPVARSPAEIAQRLREKATDPAPSERVAAIVGSYLEITATVGGASAALAKFAGDSGVDLGAALDGFNERLGLISKLRPPFWSDACFSADAGRRFEYYDGFVFDLARTNAGDRPILSGGRYDGLIARLSVGAIAASGIGAAIRADRLGGGAA